jgi:sigma-B regulation protein RsbU (phosphoserine phosphatase)
MSLGVKVTCIVLLTYVLYAAVLIVLGYSIYSKDIDYHYNMLARSIARIAAMMMDGGKIQSYARTLTEDDSYFKMRETLFSIKENNDIKFIYVEIISGDEAVYIMDADTGGTALKLGDTRPLSPQTYKYLGALEKGIPPFISNSDSGWLLSSYAPVFNSSGDVAALVGVDVSMNEIMANRHSRLRILVLTIVAAALFTVYFFLKFIRHFIVVPVNKLAAAAVSFASSDRRNESLGLAASAISSLDIHTGDEIESLTSAMKTMAKDITEYVEYITTITSEKERINTELNIASRIQSSMLPHEFQRFIDRREFDIYAVMTPAKKVGGDLYDFFMIDDDHLAMVIADVSDKGVPAALFMAISKTLLRHELPRSGGLDAAFVSVNKQLCEGNDEGMFVTAWAAVFEISTGRLSFVNAGHNPPLVRHSGGNFEYVTERPVSLPLAVEPETRYRQNRMKLFPGDILYLYTDGVTESSDAYGNMYGSVRLKEVLDSFGGTKPDEMLRFVTDDIHGFAGDAPQFDDITMLGMHVNENRDGQG